MTKDRVPPGQRITTKLPRLDLGVVPKFNEGTWRLRVEGFVEKPMKLTFAEVLKLPRMSETADFHCVTGWSRLDNKWDGVLCGHTITSISGPDLLSRWWRGPRQADITSSPFIHWPSTAPFKRFL